MYRPVLLVAPLVLLTGAPLVSARTPAPPAAPPAATPASVEPSADVAPPPAETLRVVVYDLQPAEGLEALAAKLTDELLVHLGRQPGLVVVGQSELRVMLSHERDKAVLQCDSEESCLARVSQAAQADKAITGRVGRVGDAHLVTLKLADTARAAVQEGEATSAEQVEELGPLVQQAAERLLGLQPAGERERFRMQVAPKGTQVAVIDMAAHDVSEGLAQSLTQLLSLEFKKFEGLGVISRDEIRTLLRFEADRQMLQCTDDTACLVEIGGALGVDYLVAGSVGRLGEAFVLNLKLMDIGRAVVVSRVAESFQGPERELPQALRFTVWALLGREVKGSGSLVLQTNVQEGQLSLDGGQPLELPLAEPLSDLPPGKHRITLTAEGYHPLYQETWVEPGRRTEARMHAVALPRPWYRKWWAWTLLATAVAAGVTATVLLLPDEPETGSVLVTVE